jgi:RNA polymerase sigma factor (sigma-70 family)
MGVDFISLIISLNQIYLLDEPAPVFSQLKARAHKEPAKCCICTCYPVERRKMNQETRETYRTRITLLEKVQNQYDNQAWEEFAASYQDYIYAVLRHMNIPYEDAGDLLQQVLLKLWKKLPEIDIHKLSRFRSYLAVMTKNCAHDYLRKKISERQKHEKLKESNELEYFDSITMPDINRIAEIEWNNYIAGRALENISQDFSDKAIDLFKGILSGRDIKELAEELGMGLSTAYRLKSRVKERLLSEIESLNDYLG